MIFDRTIQDVENAIRIRDEVKNGGSITDDERITLERGFLTLETLNRIEEKQTELKELLNDIGYWNTDFTNTEWVTSDVFGETDLQRIIDNEDVLKNAFFVYENTPQTPNASYHYENINALEKILYDLEEMINDVKTNFRYCNTFECGEA